MAAFDVFFIALREAITPLIAQFPFEHQSAAAKDAEAFIDSQRASLERWVQHLARGEMSLAEFRNLMQVQTSSAQMEALALRGLSLIELERFRSRLTDHVIWTAARFVQLSGGGAESAQPPPPPRPSPPSAARSTDGDEADEFELGIRRGQRTQPPPPRRRVVSTGFADLPEPGTSRDRHRPLDPGVSCYYWLEIGDQVAGAIDASPVTILPETVPVGAELTVVLFAPDDGFSATYDLGRLRLERDGTARVLAQPAPRYDDVSDELLSRRLLFPLRTPERRGRYRLRSSIYCQGVLVQSRLIEAYVGKEPRKGEPAVISTVDYTLSETLPSTLGGLEAHRLSIMVNRNDQGNHDFYFYGKQNGTTVHRPVTISATTLNGAIQRARKALREVSWGDDGGWSETKNYRYASAPTPATPDGILARLREDLALLAGRGFDVYNLVVANLTATGTRAELEQLLESPGTLQIAGKQDIRFVLPAAMIYDYKIDNQVPFEEFELCAEFAKAFRDGRPFLSTSCFQGACPIRGKVTAVCPSGFWGFRHKLGLPISLRENGSPADAAVRVEYHDVPVMVVAVSTDQKLERRETHQGQLQGLHAKWQTKGWFLGESRKAILEHLAQRKPHLVYFYCHGGLTEDKEFYLSVGTPGKGSYLLPSNIDAYVSWEEPPHPLVFINGCHTTALDADTTLEFVTQFVQVVKACGVIGTEITVFEPLAVAFAFHFWRRFLQGSIGVGEAIRDARLELLKQGNPLGLVYTPFVFAGTKLEKVG